MRPVHGLLLRLVDYWMDNAAVATGNAAGAVVDDIRWIRCIDI